MEKLYWPDFRFPPINLWSLPEKNIMTDYQLNENTTWLINRCRETGTRFTHHFAAWFSWTVDELLVDMELEDESEESVIDAREFVWAKRETPENFK